MKSRPCLGADVKLGIPAIDCLCTSHVRLGKCLAKAIPVTGVGFVRTELLALRFSWPGPIPRILSWETQA